jgi:hypothetical protein
MEPLTYEGDDYKICNGKCIKCCHDKNCSVNNSTPTELTPILLIIIIVLFGALAKQIYDRW